MKEGGEDGCMEGGILFRCMSVALEKETVMSKVLVVKLLLLVLDVMSVVKVPVLTEASRRLETLLYITSVL